MRETPQEITVDISQTVTDATDLPVEELPPLSDVIDLDALDALVPGANRQGSPEVRVTFSYAGVRVIVCSGRTVFVHPDADDSGDGRDVSYENIQ